MRICPLARALGRATILPGGLRRRRRIPRGGARAPAALANSCEDRDYVAGWNAGFAAARAGRDTSSSKVAYFTASEGQAARAERSGGAAASKCRQPHPARKISTLFIGGCMPFYRDTLGMELTGEQAGHHAQFGASPFLCWSARANPSCDKAVVFYRSARSRVRGRTLGRTHPPVRTGRARPSRLGCAARSGRA